MSQQKRDLIYSRHNTGNLKAMLKEQYRKLEDGHGNPRIHHNHIERIQTELAIREQESPSIVDQVFAASGLR